MYVCIHMSSSLYIKNIYIGIFREFMVSPLGILTKFGITHGLTWTHLDSPIHMSTFTQIPSLSLYIYIFMYPYPGYPLYVHISMATYACWLNVLIVICNLHTLHSGFHWVHL